MMFLQKIENVHKKYKYEVKHCKLRQRSAYNWYRIYVTAAVLS